MTKTRERPGPIRDNFPRGGAVERAGKQHDAIFPLTGVWEQSGDSPIQLLPRDRLPLPKRSTEALAVIQREDRGLTGGAGSAPEKRRPFVPLDLNWAAVALLHNQAASRRAGAASSRIIVGYAGRHPIGRHQQRNRVLYGSATACKRRRRG